METDNEQHQVEKMSLMTWYADGTWHYLKSH